MATTQSFRLGLGRYELIIRFSLVKFMRKGRTDALYFYILYLYIQNYFKTMLILERNIPKDAMHNTFVHQNG